MSTQQPQLPVLLELNELTCDEAKLLFDTLGCWGFDVVCSGQGDTSVKFRLEARK